MSIVRWYADLVSAITQVPAFKAIFRSFPANWRLRLLRVIQRSWYDRIRTTLSCPDNEMIPRAPDAGRVRQGRLTMHNGLQIRRGSYYGETMSVLLELNRGVHEPQEERIFHEVLNCLSPGASMLELGAYWGFYSMWFAKVVPSALCILVEPDPRNLAFGQSNFQLNGLQGTFLQGYVGSNPLGDQLPVFGVDELMQRFKLNRLDILHSDVQGAEVQMLQSAEKSLARGMIDFVFCSTHSEELHRECLQILGRHGFDSIAEASPSKSYSEDGVIAARRKPLTCPPAIQISQKQ